MDAENLRLAFRIEDGGFWRVYVAPMDTMQGAVLIGSIAIGAAQYPEVKEKFADAMSTFFQYALKDMGFEAEQLVKVALEEGEEHDRYPIVN